MTRKEEVSRLIQETLDELKGLKTSTDPNVKALRKECYMKHQRLVKEWRKLSKKKNHMLSFLEKVYRENDL